MLADLVLDIEQHRGVIAQGLLGVLATLSEALVAIGVPGAGLVDDVELGAEVEDVARWATGDLRPHLTVVLDLEPSAGLGRFEGRDRIEGESLEFHQRVREAFTQMAAADPDHYLVLDARAPIEEIAAAIRERVEALL